jgi:hypothetical protein
LDVLRPIPPDEGRARVFLTGDIHTTWAADLPVDPGTYTGTPTAASPSAVIEFVCPSITSDNLDEITGSPPRTTSQVVETGILLQNRSHQEGRARLARLLGPRPDARADPVRHVLRLRPREPQATQQFFRGLASAKGSRTVTRARAPIPSDRPDLSEEPEEPSGGTNLRNEARTGAAAAGLLAASVVRLRSRGTPAD